ncbi:MAG: hypothetical protein Q7N50_15640 [Armatimonadota bacterium]|nr:hypothetical protein [Armatimonadota bacterium]
MRYSVVIYDAIGIEEAAIVCESKADAQDMAIRCAKMYAGEDYTIEIEKEPDRWEGILGTRETRRKARREGGRRKVAAEPNAEERTDEGEVIAAREEPAVEEAALRENDRIRRGGRGARRQEQPAPEPAAEETPPVVEAPVLEQAAPTEEQHGAPRRRRGGRRYRGGQREGEGETTVQEAPAQPLPEPSVEPVAVGEAKPEGGEDHPSSRRRRGGRSRRRRDYEGDGSQAPAEAIAPEPHVATPAPEAAEQPKRRRPRYRKPDQPEAPSPVVETAQPEQREQPQPSGGDDMGGLGVSWRRPRSRRSRRPRGETTSES